MKRLLPLSVLLLLALSVRAQEGDEDPAEPEVQQAMTQEESADAAEETPIAEPAGQPDEASEAEEPAQKEEPLISVKVDSGSQPQEGDDESIEVAQPKKRAVASATVMKPVKKPKKTPAAGKSAKNKAVKTAPIVAKAKVVTPAPAAPPLPAVPLTPITPRNP